jgi:ribosomal protein L5
METVWESGINISCHTVNIVIDADLTQTAISELEEITGYQPLLVRQHIVIIQL